MRTSLLALLFALAGAGAAVAPASAATGARAARGQTAARAAAKAQSKAKADEPARGQRIEPLRGAAPEPRLRSAGFEKLPPARQQQLLLKLFRSASTETRASVLRQTGAQMHRDRGDLLASRYKSFREGAFETRELISGSQHDGLLKLLGKKGVVLDWELMRRYQATTPPTPAELAQGAERVAAFAARGGGEHHIVTSNVSEQPQIILDEKATAQARLRSGRADARVLDFDATINKNALGVRAVLDAGANVVKVGSEGLSLYEMYRVYGGLAPALYSKDAAARQPRADHNRPLQQLAGIALVDAARANDAVFTYRGRPVALDQAIDLARAGHELRVQQAGGPAERLTDIDGIVGKALMAEKAGNPKAAAAWKAKANALTARDVFKKARAELLTAKLAGLKILLFDTQRKDAGFAKFLDVLDDRQLVDLADQAHEMGMDIWGSGSVGADNYGRLVKAGWNLVCFGGAARSDSGLRPETGADFVAIDPAKVERLQQIRRAAEQTPEWQLARRKMELLSTYHSSAPRAARERAWQEYQALKTPETGDTARR